MRAPRLAGLSAATSLTLVAATGLSGAETTNQFARILTPAPASYEALSRFAAVLEAVQKHHVQPGKLGAAAHTTEALRAFIRSIDPDADLLTAEELAAIHAGRDEHAGDVGLSLALRDNHPVVISPADGSPAHNAGLLHGDQIIELNGKSTLHARLLELTQQLRGPPGSTLTLRVREPDTGHTRPVTLTRKTPGPQPRAHLKFLAAGIAYYRLADFSIHSVEQLHAATARARDQRAAALILDLRHNAGGSFDAAQVAARIFLPAGAEIVLLEYSNPGLRTTFVSDDSKKFTAPLVLLVNGGTAAEAEIFAAALRDNNRARLVGSRTFGRGVLAAQIPLPDGSALSLPTAYYLRPAKQIIHGAGLTPDVVVELPRHAERTLATAGFGAFDWINDKSQVLALDLPLAKALELLTK